MKRFVLLLVGVFLVACTSTESTDTKVASSIALLDGNPATIEQFIDGRPAVLNFWAASCVFCREELPWFQSIDDEYPGVTVLGINMQEPQQLAFDYWVEGGYKFPSLLDPDNELRRKYEVSIQPTTVLLDSSGNIVSRKDGPLREAELQEMLDDLLLTEGLFEVAEIEEKAEPEPIEESAIQTSAVPRILQSWYQGQVKHTLDLKDILSGGPPKDGIPAIDQPNFVSIEEAEFLTDDSIGILVSISGDTRYYPYAILNWHEIVNDTVGGQDIFVTYCPLCATGVAYGRQISEGTTTFGVSGLLSQSNLLMYDRATDSLWNQVTGQAVVGPLTGEELAFVSSDIVSFSTIKSQYPTAQVLSTDTGHVRDYTRDPYDGYETDPNTIFPTRGDNTTLFSKALVYGVTLDGIAKAYSLDIIKEQGIIADTIASTAIRIDYDDDTERVRITNEATGDVIPTLPIFWFSWVAQYPDTELYQ